MGHPTGIERFDLTGRTALVTGSSRGIGYALAQGLLEAGARGGCTAATPQVQASAARLREIGGVTVPTFDVTDAEAVDAGIGRIERVWGTPDICVNNAGIQRRAPFTEFADGRLARPGGDQPDQRLPGRPAGGPGHGRPGAAARSSTSARCRAGWLGRTSPRTARPRVAS